VEGEEITCPSTMHDWLDANFIETSVRSLTGILRVWEDLFLSILNLLVHSKVLKQLPEIWSQSSRRNSEGLTVNQAI